MPAALTTTASECVEGGLTNRTTCRHTDHGTEIALAALGCGNFGMDDLKPALVGHNELYECSQGASCFKASREYMIYKIVSLLVEGFRVCREPFMITCHKFHFCGLVNKTSIF